MNTAVKVFPPVVGPFTVNETPLQDACGSWIKSGDVMVTVTVSPGNTGPALLSPQNVADGGVKSISKKQVSETI